MPKQEIQLELLLGKRVIAQNGLSIGRLEEIEAKLEKGECFVTEFHIGSYAILERLSAWTISRALMKYLPASRKAGGYRVPWDKLDLSDPQRPRLLCSVSDLQPLRDEN